jgi:hypothetical protein
MKKIIFLLFALLSLLNLTFAQEKWSQDPRIMAKLKPTNYAKLPGINYTYVNPNTVTRVYYTPAGTLVVSPNVRVLPNSNQQDEVILVSNPVNTMIMFGSANTSAGSSYGQGMYITLNGGVNWFGNDILPNLPPSTSDPAPIIDKNGTFIFTTLNTTGSVATLISNYSTNNGTDWSVYQTITSLYSDKNMAGTDDVPSSAYYGNSYSVWSNFALAQPAIMISQTSNSGQNWSSPVQINLPPAGHYSAGCDVAVGPQGNVYVCWASAITPVPYTEDYCGFAKSVNGGSSWSVTENAFDMNGIRSSSFNGWGVRVNSFPRIGVDKSGGARNGWIYIVTCDQNISPAGSDPDIVLHRSTDGGTTWLAGIRVNQDEMNNGKVQFFPAINVDVYGGINITYYDNRNYPSVGDSCETFLSRSIDGGNTWTDITVSDHRWKPAPEPNFAPYMGDYIGIASGNNKVWPFWFDNKSSSMQAWTASIDLGPAINHTPLGNTELTSGTRAVNAVITPTGSPIVASLTKLFVAKDAGSFDSILMTNSSGNNWTANLTLNGAGLYKYYLRAVDNLNRVAFAPSGAPGSYYSFTAGPDIEKPVITHSPLSNIPRNLWPATVSAVVTDNLGVDSVWVKWYKNSTSTGLHRFNLNNTGGSIYTAPFNSDTSQVNYYDSIYYRIFARDISAAHNIDSTALYQFKIIALTSACIGNGVIPSYFPFTTYWMDGRTDYLYTASEIHSYGGDSGRIQKIGFTFVSADPAVINGFKIKFQQTNLTQISGFTSTGWTICYDGAYTVPGPGLQFITLSNQFAWNGHSNLLMEVCYNNASFTQYSPVYSHNAPGMFWGKYQDLETGDGCTNETWTSSILPPGRANTCFVISLDPIGIRNIGNYVPDVYSLSQNYPNPFNPITQIKFDIAKQGLTKLKIFDVLGREITTLINEVKSPGSYIVDFDASKLASGVYFYRLEAGTFIDVKRMILIK